MDLRNVIDEIKDIKINLTMALRVLIDNDDNYFSLVGKDALDYYREQASDREYIAKHFIDESLTVLESMIEEYNNREKESKNDAKAIQMS